LTNCNTQAYHISTSRSKNLSRFTDQHPFRDDLGIAGYRYGSGQAPVGLVRDRSRLMDIGLLRGKLAANHAPSVLRLRNPASDISEPREDSKPLSERTRRKLWILLVIDIVSLPWMLTFGSWFDETSRLTSVATLGGHHRLVLALAIVGSVMLAGLALWTDWFTDTRLFDRALIIVASVISILAVAGVLSVVLLLVAVVLLFGFVARPFKR
jgi:hypothetical protein